MFSLPICRICYDKKSDVEKKGQFQTIQVLKRDLINAKFKTCLLDKCSFCYNNKATHYTYGIPDFELMCRLLKYRLPHIQYNITKINNIWDVLSEEFVHFGTDKYVNKQNMILTVSDIGIIDFYKLETVCTILELLDPIMKFYIKKLKTIYYKKNKFQE